MSPKARRAIGILLSLCAGFWGLVALASSLRMIIAGAFLGLWMPAIWLAVILGLIVATLPGWLAIFGLVVNMRSADPRAKGMIVPAVGLAIAIGVGSLANRVDPSTPRRPPPPPGCRASAAEPSAINRPCPHDIGYVQGPCPNGYTCVGSASHAEESRCEVTCTDDCQCMAGAHCVNATCQFGNNLP